MLTVNDVHTYYGDSYVLQGVSMEIQQGEVTVLMGRNGAGKSTLVRSIMGLTPPRRGSIVFRESELVGQPTHLIARQGMAIVPQGRRIFASLTVREHLASAGRRSGTAGAWPVERIYEVFPRLKERSGQKASTLSGGEQSMLSIARALRTNPACLLMDEPTEGLAPTFVQGVVSVLADLKRTGDLAILLVVHELPIALSIADRIYVMSKGSIVFNGTPKELSADVEVQERHIGVGV
jgi:branched-chain amino acid transport system ATP-binding protein